MPAPLNPFKAALKTGVPQMGCWLGLADPYAAEISAGAGFDWLLIDGEHAPNDLRTVMSQLQVLAAFDSHPVVRPPVGEPWMIKQLLDAGAQTLLIPMIESAEQAQRMVDAVTYPPHGMRGVGAALARASSFSAIPDYLRTAREQICLLLQVESRAGLEALDDILAVDGVDGIFIGPSDLAADMGHLGAPNTPEVENAVLSAMTKIVAAGKAGGILSLNPTMQRACLDAGATFVATGIDVTLFSAAIRSSANAAFALLPEESCAGHAQTAHASKYLQQLCKHWSHKGQADFDSQKGSVTFPNGKRLTLTATPDRLELIAFAPARADIAAWTAVVTRHLERFGFREALSCEWDLPGTPDQTT